ncbi:AAA family ATPase [Shinella zoogloeoides]|uniref:AAA family ATPase n=1 Tax=Shinella zoogloeoides TaxID=352475 RepID=UPI00273E5C39|nr:DUF3696 domain-containing protein [Shinella zoogloeoides]WLR93882.1 DUF3696 domain-containing protein [Shinella zoogloeoides]
MFKSWKIHNFKSFKTPPEIPLSKINILAGANSSGKSTIIQSILLLKQTVQYGAQDRGVSLNGPLLRMGEFSDIRNFDAEGESISIEFEIKPENQGEFNAWGTHRTSSFLPSGLNDVDYIRSRTVISQVFVQERTDPSIKSKLFLDQVDFSATFKDDKENTTQNISLRSTYRGHDDDNSKAAPFDVFSASLDDQSIDQLSSTHPKLEVLGGSARHFLPDYVLLRYDAAVQKAGEIATYLCSNPSSMFARNSQGDEILPIGVLTVLNEWLTLKRATIIETEEPVSASEARHRIAPILFGSTRRDVNTLDISGKTRSEQAVLRSMLTEALITETTSNPTFDLDMPRVLKAASDYVRRFFQQGVRYLGPLRDAPRPVYPLEALESTTDVGYRGEHTAAVFQLNSYSSVSFHLPPTDDFDSNYFEYATPETHTLHDAAVKWLGYLGVADELKATDSGVFGNRLQVSTGNVDRWHDLTNVGVGVSQVLPLVVTSLLAPAGSLLIFEQPELHLHPRVQARLADFFISLALSGKQMILETHSEYLIDRLRLRIALAERDDVRHLVNILFTEKHDGKSEIRPIEVSEFGAISNWPKDFFDQSQNDVARLIKAAARKRANKSNKQ